MHYASIMRIDVSLVPRRAQLMTPYEVMLSESQERMLVVVRPATEAAARKVFDHFELHADRIGTVTGTARIRIRDHGVSVADIPLKALVDGVPLRSPVASFPDKQPTVVMPAVEEPEAVLLDLIASPNLRSRRPIYRTYDHRCRTTPCSAPDSMRPCCASPAPTKDWR